MNGKTSERLEYLRGELRAERISYGELHELQSLAEFIEPGDNELLEAAGVPEFPEHEAPTTFTVRMLNDVRECTLKDGVFTHVLDSSFQMKQDDPRIIEVKPVPLTDSQIQILERRVRKLRKG